MPNHKRPYRTTLVNFHLPVELADRIHEYAKSHGKPKVKVAMEAFEAYLKDDVPKVPRLTYGYAAELDDDV